jgi:hypothetical protein
VFLWIIWFLTIPVAILEGKGLGESAARSVELTKGWRPHILVINVLYVVLVYVFTLLWEVPLLVSFMFNANVNDPTTVMPPWAAVGFVVGAFLTSCLSSPLLALSSSLVYYNQRVTKEAFDLEHMMSTMDDIPAPPPIS